ncbi:MAG: hypothetical protein VYC39_05465 [Myxococcota bacterium]|nr:hypothetical protein [Myxococcota bacterium]
MSHDKRDILDYVDQEFDWTGSATEDNPSSSLEAELMALLEDGGQLSQEAVMDPQEQLLSELDAALEDIESEIKAEVQEIASPINDAVELVPSWDRIYKVGSQNFICTDRITSAPQLKNQPGRQNEVRSDLSQLLGKNLNMSRMQRLRRKAK